MVALALAPVLVLVLLAPDAGADEGPPVVVAAGGEEEKVTPFRVRLTMRVNRKGVSKGRTTEAQLSLAICSAVAASWGEQEVTMHWAVL